MVNTMSYISKFVCALVGLLGFKVGLPSTGPLTGPPLIAIRDDESPKSLPPLPFDPISWALANPWLSAGQADDRTPMDGSVADIGGTPSEQRSFARRSHQLMFKKWSQNRHD